MVACSGPLPLRVSANDVEPWPDGFQVVQTASVVEAAPEGGSGPDREATIWVLETSRSGAEEAAAEISNHLETRGWLLSPTFDSWPSFVGVLEEPATIVMIGTASALAAAPAPANAAGAASVDAAPGGEGARVVVEVIAR